MEPFRMRQEHDPDGESSETRFVGSEHLACTANRATTMVDAELGGNDEDVVILLLVAELLEHVRRLCRLAEPVGTELTFTVVVELAVAGLLDHREHLLDRFAVGGGDRLPLRDGEPSFGVLGKLTFGDLLIGETDAGEQLAQTVGLLGDSLGLVAREVAVVAGDLFVLELVGDRQNLERGESRSADCFGEFVAVFDDALGVMFVETEPAENLLDGVGCESADLLDLTGGCVCLSNHVHCVISNFSELPKSLGDDLSLYETSEPRPKLSRNSLVS